MGFVPVISNRYFCLVMEGLILLVVVALSLTRPNLGSSLLSSLEARLRSLARHARLAVFFVGFLCLAGRLCLLPVLPVPSPSVHDEFSYQLAGNTFAKGRLTNQTHRFWPHFESVHILQKPTYMSMYPPAQGIALAAGKVLAGHLWAGVMFSTVLMSMAICWMLQGWLSRPLALVGAVLLVVRWCWFSYWMNSYWGGAVAAFGGALVLGSLPRLVRRPKLRNAGTLGLGLSILAISRPYEGLMFAVLVVAGFIIWSARWKAASPFFGFRVVGMLVAVLSATSCFILYYNWRITGSPFLFPYMADRQEYATAPLFLFGRVRTEPTYQTPRLHQVYDAEKKLYEREQAFYAIPESLRKLKDFWIFYVGPILTLPITWLFVGDRCRYHREAKLASIVVVVLIAAVLPEVWFYPHYTAPAMSAMVLLFTVGLQRLRTWKWHGQPSGVFLSRALPVACLALGLIPLSAATFKVRLDYWPLSWYGGDPDIVRPQQLVDQILSSGREALVFVRYDPNYPVGDEWVYNDPDIDRSPIVWAREVSACSDAGLIRYFHNRRIWTLRVRPGPWVLEPYKSRSKP